MRRVAVVVGDDIRCVVDMMCDIRIDFLVDSFVVEFIGMFFRESYL